MYEIVSICREQASGTFNLFLGKEEEGSNKYGCQFALLISGNLYVASRGAVG